MRPRDCHIRIGAGGFSLKGCSDEHGVILFSASSDTQELSGLSTNYRSHRNHQRAPTPPRDMVQGRPLDDMHLLDDFGTAGGRTNKVQSCHILFRPTRGAVTLGTLRAQSLPGREPPLARFALLGLGVDAGVDGRAFLAAIRDRCLLLCRRG